MTISSYAFGSRRSGLRDQLSTVAAINAFEMRRTGDGASLFYDAGQYGLGSIFSASHHAASIPRTRLGGSPIDAIGGGASITAGQESGTEGPVPKLWAAALRRTTQRLVWDKANTARHVWLGQRRALLAMCCGDVASSITQQTATVHWP